MLALIIILLVISFILLFLAGVAFITSNELAALFLIVMGLGIGVGVILSINYRYSKCMISSNRDK